MVIIDQIGQALHAAHEVGLVHRDVKPSNILVTDRDFAYLIDFGIARAAGETGLTSTGATIGTWSCTAPERFSTGYAEAGSDIYALACVLYECLTGELPFPAVALEQIMAAHMTTPPPQPSTQRSAIPAAMDGVIATGMAKEPDQRYATTVELADAARDAITAPIQPPAPAPTHVPTTQQAHNRVPAQPMTLKAESPALARPAPPQPAPPIPTRVAGISRRTTIALIASAVAVVVVAIGIFSLGKQGPSASSPTSSVRSYGTQLALPFTGLGDPIGVEVDVAGNVYVVDDGNYRVLKLAAGSSTQTVLPFTGVKRPINVSGGGRRRQRLRH